MKSHRNEVGQFHRVDGPAVEHTDGMEEWYLHGICHRIDGPAVEWDNGIKMWYLHGKEYTETEFNFWKEFV